MSEIIKEMNMYFFRAEFKNISKLKITINI